MGEQRADNQDVEHLEWDGETFRPVEGAAEPSSGRRDLFLKGPIPVSWLARAAKCGLPALVIGLELWLLSGLRKSKVVDLNLSRLRLAVVRARQSNQRGLRNLEEAGLVRVTRHPGRRSRVEILA